MNIKLNPGQSPHCEQGDENKHRYDGQSFDEFLRVQFKYSLRGWTLSVAASFCST
jgi:hypothetical protein